MSLESIRVIHIRKDWAGCEALSKQLSSAFSGLAFHLETCQRKVWTWVENDPENASILSFPEEFLDATGADYLSGQDAYCFLLRIASGLESEILGETDVFGQMKMAWKKTEDQFLGDFHCSFNSVRSFPPRNPLQKWMQNIFEDTKEIRTQYLQNLGGSSYGTLVRRMIKKQNPGKPILLIGAGQIAESVAPFLLDSELWIWNRNPDRLDSLYQRLREENPVARIRKLQLSEEEWGWKQSSHVVICTPLNHEWDQKKVLWLKQNDPYKQIIHLGGLEGECKNWRSLPNFSSLSELFALQDSLGNVRSMKVAYAKSACEHRSKLRALGSSLSIPHGWEDLACFN